MSRKGIGGFERSSGFAMLVALPNGYKPEHVAPALARKAQTLPEALRRSLTWDQGPEMRDWKQVHLGAGIEVFFCDPHSPWQRGSNENTNGLLRQYFAKGFDFSTVTEAQLDAVAAVAAWFLISPGTPAAAPQPPAEPVAEPELAHV